MNSPNFKRKIGKTRMSEVERRTICRWKNFSCGDDLFPHWIRSKQEQSNRLWNQFIRIIMAFVDIDVWKLSSILMKAEVGVRVLHCVPSQLSLNFCTPCLLISIQMTFWSLHFTELHVQYIIYVHLSWEFLINSLTLANHCNHVFFLFGIGFV